METGRLGFKVLGFRVWGVTSLCLARKEGMDPCTSPYMGGCQNYGPFLDPSNNTAPNIYGTQKGIIILASTQITTRNRVVPVCLYILSFPGNQGKEEQRHL